MSHAAKRTTVSTLANQRSELGFSKIKSTFISAVALTAFLLVVTPMECEGADEKIPALDDVHHTDKSYRLVWQEEFRGAKLDRKKWVAVDDPKIGQYGHGNGESQAYLDAEGDTFFVRDGRLTIVAHHTPEAKYPLRDKPFGKFKHNIDHQEKLLNL